MTDLLTELLDAHGGLERWRTVASVRAEGRFGGLLHTRFPGNRMSHFVVDITTAEQRVTIRDFPTLGGCTVFDRGDVRVATADGAVVGVRRQARKAFRGFGALRRAVRWDVFDAGYFAGYALWNYLCQPFLFVGDDVDVRDAGYQTVSYPDGRRETLRRLEVGFGPGVHTHSPRQAFFVDSAGLIRRHDYVAEPVGKWAHAAHFSDSHDRVDGLIFARHRRVYPHLLGDPVLPGPVLVALDIDDLHLQHTTGRRD